MLTTQARIVQLPFLAVDRWHGQQLPAEPGSLFIDRNGLATLYGANTYIVLGDHQPERAVAGRPLTFSDYKIWRLASGQTFDFANRPTCGYYLRSVTNGVTNSNLYNGTPVSSC
ncbi:hypothetical protein ACFWWM_09940 [Streptomyces sp. NPDC058682]|uniref:hypothetical protein n=1 Tax=Streptomyces sp. NPDC058682 TaxID=3346596 RepID=UPI00364DCF07